MTVNFFVKIFSDKKNSLKMKNLPLKNTFDGNQKKLICLKYNRVIYYLKKSLSFRRVKANLHKPRV